MNEWGFAAGGDFRLLACGKGAAHLRLRRPRLGVERGDCAGSESFGECSVGVGEGGWGQRPGSGRGTPSREVAAGGLRKTMGRCEMRICPARPGAEWKRRSDASMAMVDSSGPVEQLLRLLGGPGKQSVASSGDALSPGETFRVGLFSGAIAGTVVDFVLFPLDTFKTRLQSGTLSSKEGINILKGIYRGLLPAVLASAPSGAAFFGTYDYLKGLLKQLDVNNNFATLQHMLAAVAGDFAGSAVRVPFEVVKQRMQAGSYSSALQVVRSIVSTEGIRGLYTGFGSLVIREMPFDLIEFPLYEALKTAWAQQMPDGHLATWQTALCGSVSGGFAAAVTTPLDVVKTRLMLQDPPGKYKGVVDALTKIMQEEGMPALASGIVPRVLWISLGGFIFFGGYEVSKEIFTDRIRQQRLNAI